MCASNTTGPGEWDTLENAAAYVGFSDRFDYYRAAACALVAAAAPERGDRVVDMGCGTGVSTEPLCRAVGSEGQVRGIDPAVSMLAHARRRRWPAAVRFVEGDVNQLADAAKTFNVVICASVVWLIDDRASFLRLVRTALVPGGRLALSIPAELVGEVDHLLEESAVEFQIALGAVRERLGLSPPAAASSTLPTLDAQRPAVSTRALMDRGFGGARTDSWPSELLRAGFSRVSIERFRYECTLAEWVAHLSLPAVISSYLPTSSESQRQLFIEELRHAVDLSKRVRRRWILLLAHC